jgi:DUF1680 family protein
MQTHSCVLVILLISMMSLAMLQASAGAATDPRANLALAAHVSTSFVSGHESLTAINDGFEPSDSQDHSHGCYGNWPEHGTQWVQYEWDQPISTNGIGVYWWDDNQGVRLPKAARVLYWDGNTFAPVPGDAVLGVEPRRFNTVNFSEVKTSKIRLEMDATGDFSTGVIEWQVYDSGKSPAFPPVVHAGHDRVVVIPAVTYLHGNGRAIGSAAAIQTWSKATGPGEVTFADAHDPNTTASFSLPGDYDLKFTYEVRGLASSATVHVRAELPPAEKNLNAVYVSHYSMNSPFWQPRLKNLIINWIPHCVAECERPDLREGGLNNLIEAGKKLRGEKAELHRGYPFSNAWVLNTVESMCVALTYDPQGDPEIIRAQNNFRATLDKWIPIILAAQEKDGYFQTRFTLGTASDQQAHYHATHWNPETRGEHEGYVAGYFIEMGIAHFDATGGKDRRLFDAAIRLADCWCDHIGPGKQVWFDGHQEMEQALVRLGRFVNDLDGPRKGQKYIDLAKFLLDSRTGGSEYDQSHVPMVQQYEAVGHAVRATYTYSAMADVAMETGDPGYWSAALSIWDDMVNRKFYVTGGIGSGETSEGFGPDYSLPNASAYCESCSSCGVLFMQYKLNLATRDAKYADVYETTLYNALLGSVDLPAHNFTYTNPLETAEARYPWHVCPCCVGNIPRVLLMLPTWMYARTDDGVYVNLFAGSTVDVGKVAGGDLQMVQTTNYPWDGKVSIAVNPATAAKFTVHIRSPRREASMLYTAVPNSDGLFGLTVNGQVMDIKPGTDGYIAIDRTWKPGDTIAFELPMKVQQVTASDKVKATRGRVAIQRGPLMYDIESVDQKLTQPLGLSPDLKADWSPDLLGGVMSVHGTFADGTPLLAIPNYARANRGGRSMVWMLK